MKKDIKFIEIPSPKYPKKLKKIKYPPKKIYYLGNLKLFKEKYYLAIVGTRNCTVYGKQVTKILIPEIANGGIVIVSGLAKGIDVFAHRLTFENKGKIIAVLAGGLDNIYPPEHKKFAEEVVEAGGLLISEHPPGTEYLRQYFPARNRIISGLADVVLVVEAKDKSGALITANFAFSQGRKILAVPGSVLSPQSRGVNTLFKKGAIPVQGTEDIFAALFGRKRKILKSVEADRCAKSNLNKEEKKIFEIIPIKSSISLNKIIRKSNLTTAKVVSIITQLELKGIVEQVNGEYTQSI